MGTAPVGPSRLECLHGEDEGNLLLMFLPTLDHSFPPLDFFAVRFPKDVKWNLMKFSCLNSKKPETLSIWCHLFQSRTVGTNSCLCKSRIWINRMACPSEEHSLLRTVGYLLFVLHVYIKIIK